MIYTKTMIFTWNLPKFKNTKYIKFQVDASRFTDTFWKPEFWAFFTFYSYIAAYGDWEKHFQEYAKIKIVSNKKTKKII